MTPPHFAPAGGPRWLNTALNWLGGLLFLVTFFSTLLGMMARYFGWNDLEWTFETADISFIWVTFIGAVLAEMRGENVRFTSVVTLLPDKGRRVLRLFTPLVLLGICLWLLVSGLTVLHASAWVPTPVLRMPTGVITFALISFSVLTGYIALWRIWRFFFPTDDVL
ncbi:TRAP transporter small permease [Martelella alba]|uniref:TRAP transporter small permease protein n=1 Tax=Martelella alba TaxID=2590451 RepID=A0ABY2SJM5_9HYPH|nr:TRAP transporter small permease subunit [Martelella alba]TKI05198.1 TRAP transporter small permease subunit [Martelella alba]